MERKGISIAGNLIVDRYKKIENYPNHSTLTSILDVTYGLGGAAYSCSVGMAKLDQQLPVSVIGVVGNDSEGDTIINSLKSYANIDVKYVRKSSVTSFTDVFEDVTNNTRTFFQYRGANAELSYKDFNLNQNFSKILHVGYILLLDELDKENTKYGTNLAEILYNAQKLGIKTSIDIVSEASNRFSKLVPPALRYTDYCIINEYEAGKTCDISVRDCKGELDIVACKKVCNQLFDYGVSTWVVIHSREGAIGMDANREFYYVNSICLEKNLILSTTGAGDALLSGALYSAYQGSSLLEAMQLGLATAAASLLGPNSTDGIKTAPEMRSFYSNAKKEDWECFRGI